MATSSPNGRPARSSRRAATRRFGGPPRPRRRDTDLMRSRPEIITLLTDPGIIAVVRAQRQDQVLPLSEALIAGGVIAVEITMTTPNAIEAIREAKAMLGDRA